MRPVGILLFFFITSGWAQLSTSGAKALDARSQVIEASGGTAALAAVKSYAASGTITYYEQEKQDTGTVTIKALGRDLLRLDASTDNGARSWSLSGPSGKAKQGGGKATVLSGEVALNLRHYALPVSVFSRTNVEDLSLKQKSGDPETLRRMVAAPPAKNAALAGKPTEYQVDGKTGRILRVSSEVRGRAGVAPILQEFVYSDYRSVNGILFPFVIEEWNAGQLISRVQLERISVNSGLAATDFDLE